MCKPSKLNKIEVVLFGPPPLRASPYAVIFAGTAILINGEQTSRKDARASEKHILSHQKLPVLL
jgi:hypothetical protein